MELKEVTQEEKVSEDLTADIDEDSLDDANADFDEDVFEGLTSTSED